MGSVVLRLPSSFLPEEDGVFIMIQLPAGATYRGRKMWIDDGLLSKNEMNIESVFD